MSTDRWNTSSEASTSRTSWCWGWGRGRNQWQCPSFLILETWWMVVPLKGGDELTLGMGKGWCIQICAFYKLLMGFVHLCTSGKWESGLELWQTFLCWPQRVPPPGIQAFCKTLTLRNLFLTGRIWEHWGYVSSMISLQRLWLLSC